MKFGLLQKAFFNAEDGAYSPVTEDERKKAAITITASGGESQIVINHFGVSGIPRGGAHGNKQRLNVISRNGKEQEGELSITFPKAAGNELRIYRSVENGFDYEAGDVWFVFLRSGRLFAGSMPRTRWDGIRLEDEDEDAYQADIQTQSPAPAILRREDVMVQTSRYPRDPAVARKALRNAAYTCEYSGEKTPFSSRATGHPYTEAHHLVPLGSRSLFPVNLDCAENIVALSPLWHRAVHHGDPLTVRKIITTLAARRPEILKMTGLSLQDLLQLYGC